MSFGHAQVNQQLLDTFGSHAAATVGVNGQLTFADVLPGATFANQALGKLGGLAVRHHPANHVAAENVDDDVKIKIRPLGWTFELGDIPRPHLIGRGGKQFGLAVVGTTKLISAFVNAELRLVDGRSRRAEGFCPGACARVAYLTQREWLSHALHAICSSARNKAPRGVAVCRCNPVRYKHRLRPKCAVCHRR